MKKITIDNQDYLLDVEYAVSQGSLVKLNNYPLLAGDVYHPATSEKAGHNPYLLVEALYNTNNRRFQLLGLGARSNSGIFFDTLHTKEEIRQYLSRNEMVFVKNINNLISTEVNSK